MKTTIYDIAKAAGVSIATVSKVINGTGRISTDTRERVHEIMQELDYQPSVVASALTGKSTFTIGLLIPDLANPLYAEIARSVEDRGRELGFNLVMCSTDNNPRREGDYITFLKQKKVDGIIISTGISNEAVLQSLHTQNIPVAFVTRDHIPGMDADSVRVDDYLGGYRAASHLLGLGHRHVAVLTEQLSLSSSSDRVRGFIHALEEAGIEEGGPVVVESFSSIEEGRRQTLELLISEDAPTALFACNDLLAIGAVQAAKELRLTIPWDVSIIGFDNTMLAGIVDPPLTTISQPIAEMGRRVMDLIIQEVRGEKKGKTAIVLTPELVVRQSTTFPRKV
ncbi:LacI family DNA-binding transcriptional regulator [Paenibacillus ginsengarvi]|uniref:LacI family transcriptional regulator n=1 Tax=Paenibacillus ginsengarvi TaxID=400777 RepID=A0A3B0D007_9BACL|nr:LacI family DNA-binding transcriptional regulator [Paenibacillus ginsengarvi]RKN86976.1 LacI family transcriptional regulator [Paenibacillus ginsengarvi]